VNGLTETVGGRESRVGTIAMLRLQAWGQFVTVGEADW